MNMEVDFADRTNCYPDAMCHVNGIQEDYITLHWYTNSNQIYALLVCPWSEWINTRIHSIFFSLSLYRLLLNSLKLYANFIILLQILIVCPECMTDIPMMIHTIEIIYESKVLKKYQSQKIVSNFYLSEVIYWDMCFIDIFPLLSIQHKNWYLMFRAEKVSWDICQLIGVEFLSLEMCFFR